MVHTYNPKEVVAAFGSHIISGFAEDTFISIEAKGEGIPATVGCDGEVVRSVSPDDTYDVKITLLYGSESSSYFQSSFNRDKKTGDAAQSLIIKDLKGGLVFSADQAWVSQVASRSYGKTANSREWTLTTGQAEMNE